MSLISWSLRLGALAVLAGIWLLAGVYLALSPGLPDVATLRDVRLQTPMRVYTRDGDLIGQFGEQKRNPLHFEQIPPQFVDALLAAEDDGFFEHSGIDIGGLLRAVSELILTGQKGSGGSTLTMQVARNYFLTLERTFLRKFNEILLAIEIERRLSKEEIFELYANRVFLGHRAYGFEAASQVYYGRSISELSLAQHAMLAGVPKSPSYNNPISGPEAGKERRNWILGRMRALEYIDEETYRRALAAPVTAQHHGARIAFSAQYVAEMVRREMLDRYGADAYTAGYSVYTTIDSTLQQVAQRALIDGLVTYDGRHGHRGAERRFPVGDAEPQEALNRWREALQQIPVIAGMTPAIVTAVDDEGADLLLPEARRGRLLWEDGLRQARPYLSEDRRGRSPKQPSDVLSRGDLIRLQRNEEQRWALAQVPAAQGAVVSLDPNNGGILSLVGGMGFELSKFNRATQARRQPGSNFKPFLYAAALDAGYTAASIINDAPVVREDASLEGLWRPVNDGGRFYGPTRLRWALTKSRNIVSIRLLQQLGPRRFIDYLTELGFDTADFQPDLSLALGTHAMTPLDVASAYAILANGGFRVKPHLIERIEDVDGSAIFESDAAAVCSDCGGPGIAERELSMEEILRRDALPKATRVMDERVHFIIDDMLKDVITAGTGRKARSLERADIAGKTGTTNGPVDAWFSGYSPSIVTTTWVGFDDYSPLGQREYGGSAALPIWIDFMREALRERPESERKLPAGISHVRIDPDSGYLAPVDQRNAIFEYFRDELVPPPADEAAGRLGTDPLLQEIF